MSKCLDNSSLWPVLWLDQVLTLASKMEPLSVEAMEIIFQDMETICNGLD